MYTVGTPDKTIRVLRDPRRSQALETMSHLAAGPVPQKPKSLRLFHELEEKGLASDSRLILKSDPGLLSLALKELSKTEIASSSISNPFTTIETMNPEQFKTFASGVISHHSPHKIIQATTSQVMQLRQSIISTTASEKIASALSDNDSEIGDEAFIVSFMRQHSLNLIAWNYPRIFLRALTLSKKGSEPLSQYLRRLLGLAPEAISFTIARDWKLGPECRRAIIFNSQLGSTKIEDNFEVARANILGNAAEIGESFAQAQEPSIFPKAKERWEETKSDIEKRLGSTEWKKLSDEIEQTTTDELKSLAHALGKNQHDISGIENPEASRNRKIFDLNPYLRRCPESLQERFKSVYENIQETQVSIAALEKLFGDVVPNAGFISGCVFMLDAAQTTLVPTVQIGKRRPKGYPKFDARKSGVIPESLYCVTPVLQAASLVEGSIKSIVCGSFSSNDKDGVLYLEIDESAALTARTDALLYYEAIRRCFVNCLGH